MDGFLNLHKPPGPTSFAMVAKVRRWSRARRVGHAGTLDPLASGVLPLLLGRATRLAPYLLELPKVYRAEVRLGQATTTYDAQGQVTWEGDPSTVDEARLREALVRFQGEVEQTPPLYSALKVAGRPAYLYARAGQPLALPSRRVRIDRLQLLEFQPPLVRLEIECSRGTYIRSLAHDLGLALGCGAHLTSLVRLRLGPFTLEQAASPEEVQEAFASGAWPRLLLPLDFGLSHLPAVHLTPEQAEAARHGRLLPGNSLPSADADRLRAYGPDGALLAILHREGPGWRPRTVLAPARPSPPSTGEG